MRRKTSFYYDLYRCEGDRANKLSVRLKSILFTPGCKYVYYFRHASEAKYMLTKLFCSLLLYRTRLKTGLDKIIPCDSSSTKKYIVYPVE